MLARSCSLHLGFLESSLERVIILVYSSLIRPCASSKFARSCRFSNFFSSFFSSSGCLVSHFNNASSSSSFTSTFSFATLFLSPLLSSLAVVDSEQRVLDALLLLSSCFMALVLPPSCLSFTLTAIYLPKYQQGGSLLQTWISELSSLLCPASAIHKKF